MDFSDSFYEHSVDENHFTMVSPTPTLSLTQLQHFVASIMSTLELKPLGSVYFHQLGQYLPIVSVSLADIEPSLVYGEQASRIALPETIRLPVRQTDIGPSQKFIHYYFTRSLNRGERKLLAEFHYLFIRQLQQAQEFTLLKQMATKDPLTGLGNRTGFNDACNRMQSRAIRYGDAFALLIIDLDNFKQVNDTLGHKEGDKVLETVAEEMRHLLRGEDEAFRFGGDEFCCLLDCATDKCINTVAQRLQHQICANPYLTRLGVSCSIGGAVYQTHDDINSLFDRADSALYKVKSSGKNAYFAA